MPDRVLIVENGTLVEPFEPTVPDACVIIEDGTVTFSGRRPDAPRRQGASRLDARGGYVVPGLVDIHVHGGGGSDTMDASPEGLRLMTLAHARLGTTSLLCTTVTAPREELVRAERAVVEAASRQQAWWAEDEVDAERDGDAGWGARIAGIHLEGPYLNPERKGAQHPSYMRDPSTEELEQFLEASRLDGRPMLRLMTIAPERPGSIEAIRWLVARGVAVSIGHSAVEGDRLEQAVRAGASQVTHLFNGMAPFHHRTPGLAGAALSDDRLIAQLIADGVHVHPVAMRVAYRARGARSIALITDALAPAGLGEGRFRLGELEVEVRGGACRLPDGTLAGSIQGLGEMVRRMVQAVGVPLPEAVGMASRVPAGAVGLGGRAGTLRPGAWGDVAVLDAATLEVRAAVVAGRVVFEA